MNIVLSGAIAALPTVKKSVPLRDPSIDTDPLADAPDTMTCAPQKLLGVSNDSTDPIASAVTALSDVLTRGIIFPRMECGRC
jgi:hypothetical protein